MLLHSSRVNEFDHRDCHYEVSTRPLLQYDYLRIVLNLRLILKNKNKKHHSMMSTVNREIRQDEFVVEYSIARKNENID